VLRIKELIHNAQLIIIIMMLLLTLVNHVPSNVPLVLLLRFVSLVILSLEISINTMDNVLVAVLMLIMLIIIRYVNHVFLIVIPV
jgi:hypothetical protein